MPRPFCQWPALRGLPHVPGGGVAFPLAAVLRALLVWALASGAGISPAVISPINRGSVLRAEVDFTVFFCWLVPCEWDALGPWGRCHFYDKVYRRASGLRLRNNVCLQLQGRQRCIFTAANTRRVVAWIHDSKNGARLLHCPGLMTVTWCVIRSWSAYSKHPTAWF